ncbi:hypothetical protein Tco_0133073 [Tanacetum coccineum]
MDKDPSIPRRNKVNWHYARDDPMFTTINVISRNEDTQFVRGYLPVALTTRTSSTLNHTKSIMLLPSGSNPPNTKEEKQKTTGWRIISERIEKRLSTQNNNKKIAVKKLISLDASGSWTYEGTVLSPDNDGRRTELKSEDVLMIYVHPKLTTHEETNTLKRKKLRRMILSIATIHTPLVFQHQMTKKVTMKLKESNVEGAKVRMKSSHMKRIQGNETESIRIQLLGTQTNQSICLNRYPPFLASFINILSNKDAGSSGTLQSQLKYDRNSRKSQLQQINNFLDSIDEGMEKIYQGTSPISQRQLYKALVDAYEAEKILLDTYGDTITIKRPRDGADDDQEPSAGIDRGSKRRRSGKEPASTSAPSETTNHECPDEHAEKRSNIFLTGFNNLQDLPSPDKHGIKGDFPQLRIQDIEEYATSSQSQGKKVTNTNVEDVLHLMSPLRMFPRKRCHQRRVEDLQLGVEKLSKETQPSQSLTKYRSNLEDKRLNTITPIQEDTSTRTKQDE